MTTGRLVVVGAAGIALFLATALYAVDRLISVPPPLAGVAPDPVVAARPWTPQSATAAATPPASDLPAGLGGVGMKPVVVMDPTPPPPPPGSWEAVPISRRATAMGKAGTALGQELNEMHPVLSACFDEDAQARHGTSEVAVVRDRSPQADSGVPVLVLQVETMNGAIRIVDAPVEARGDASDGLLACAQSKLRGKVVEAPGTRPGERFRVLHMLLP
jgi:hypothetical protein